MMPRRQEAAQGGRPWSGLDLAKATPGRIVEMIFGGARRARNARARPGLYSGEFDR